MGFERVSRVKASIAARELGMSRRTVLRMVRDGKLDGVHANPHAVYVRNGVRMNNSPLLIRQSGPRSIDAVLQMREAC